MPFSGRLPSLDFEREHYVTTHERIEELMTALPVGMVVGFLASLLVFAWVASADRHYPTGVGGNGGGRAPTPDDGLGRIEGSFCWQQASCPQRPSLGDRNAVWRGREVNSLYLLTTRFAGEVTEFCWEKVGWAGGMLCVAWPRTGLENKIFAP